MHWERNPDAPAQDRQPEKRGVLWRAPQHRLGRQWAAPVRCDGHRGGRGHEAHWGRRGPSASVRGPGEAGRAGAADYHHALWPAGRAGADTEGGGRRSGYFAVLHLPPGKADYLPPEAGNSADAVTLRSENQGGNLLAPALKYFGAALCALSGLQLLLHILGQLFHHQTVGHIAQVPDQVLRDRAVQIHGVPVALIRVKPRHNIGVLLPKALGQTGVALENDHGAPGVYAMLRAGGADGGVHLPADQEALPLPFHLKILLRSGLWQEVVLKPRIVGHSASSHSACLKPTNTKSSPTRMGRLTSIPSEARRANCSSSLMVGSLSLSSKARYCWPLVLKKRFRGRPLLACHSLSSASVGLSFLMSRATKEESGFSSHWAVKANPRSASQWEAFPQVVHLG